MWRATTKAFIFISNLAFTTPAPRVCSWRTRLSDTPLGDWEKADADPTTGRVTQLDLKGTGLQGRLPRGLAVLTELTFLDLEDNPDLLPITGAPTDSHGRMVYHTHDQVQAFLRHLALGDRDREDALQRRKLVERHGSDGPALRATFDEANRRSWVNERGK